MMSDSPTLIFHQHTWLAMDAMRAKKTEKKKDYKKQLKKGDYIFL